MIPHLSPTAWALCTLAALLIGIAKAGMSGMGIPAIAIYGSIFGARDSTGVVLPMLITADIGAVWIFQQHARWEYIRRLLAPAIAGIIIGTMLMSRMDNDAFRPLLGGILLGLTVMQGIRVKWPNAYGGVPHAKPVGWTLGLLTGFTTMTANAAGPIMAVYCVAVGLPKLEVVGTIAWFFFIVNLVKVPFSVSLGVIHGSSLLLDLFMAPAIVAGLLVGRWMVHHVSQRLFEAIVLILAAIAATRLLL